MIYVCSDFHFYHDKDFLYAPRGFRSIEEANAEMIKRYNEVVEEEDIVYILGDLGLNATGHEICELVAKLKGKKYLVIGNHDSNVRVEAYKESGLFEAVDFGFRLVYNKKTFWLTHYPMLVANYDDKPNYNIHGHTHDFNHLHADWPHCIDVSPETNNCYPISMEDILEIIKEEKRTQN
jgi:calcineurin-like phosphoesterase family protein